MSAVTIDERSALVLIDPASPCRCRCSPKRAFPVGTLAASENRSGLYLESNGIFEMVRNLVKNTDDVRHPYLTPPRARRPHRDQDRLTRR
jgi:hypothetical protein